MAKILVVDDDPAIRTLLRTTLEPAGHTISEAANGSQAMKAFSDGPPDLVITDIFMPDRDGLGLIRELRTIDPKARIIAMSGGSRITPGNFLMIAQHIGAAAAMAKPFSPIELMSLVERVLSETAK